MKNNGPTPLRRKLVLAVLAGGVGLSLVAMIVSFTVSSFSSPPRTQHPLTPELTRDVTSTRPISPPLDDSAGETRQSSFEASGSPVVIEGVEPEVQLAGIIPSPRIVTLKNLGDSQQLAVQGYHSDGSISRLEGNQGTPITYESSDPSVAEVSPSGIVTAMKKGGSDIKVGYGELTAMVPVLVWGEIRSIPPIDTDRLVPIEGRGTKVVVNRLMVRLEPGFGPEAAREIASSISGDVIFGFSTFPGYIIEIDARTVDGLHRAIAALEGDQRVTHAYADQIAPASQEPTLETIESLVNRKNANAYLVGAGMRSAWLQMNPDLGNPNLGVLTPEYDPVIIAVIDSDFPDAVSPLLAKEFDSGNIDRPNFSTPTPTLTATPSNSSERVSELHLDPSPGAIPPTVPSVYPQGPLDKGRIHVFDLVPGEGDPGHGVSVTSIIVAANNDPTLSPDGFSGVVTSVLGLDYDVLFYGVGLDATNSGGSERFDLTQTTTALNMINAFEHMIPYMGQIDVVNISFTLDCHLPNRKDCHLQDDWHELMSDKKAPN